MAFRNTTALLAILIVFPLVAWPGDEDHWAFQPIVRPPAPELDSKNAPSSPIDAFIQAKFSDTTFAPSPPADPHTLLRRLHFDLTGLLPTSDEVEAFLSDFAADEETAYRAKVESLLASPHFGERWGRQWLDLARYADSDGYLGDTIRPWAWIYRDWVIDAVNRDQPFDQFSIEQLAGDLLPKPTQNQLIATGFQRNNLKNTEAGADSELNRTKQVVDRVATTGTTWLGLTLACAECHDHKHDPISQREFYQLYAFFNNTNDVDISVRLKAEWPAYENKLKQWEAKYTELEKSLAEIKPQPVAKTAPSTNWETIKPDQVTAAGTTLKIEPDHSVSASGKLPSTVTYFVEAPVTDERTVSGFKLDVFGEFGAGKTRGKPVGRGKNGEFVLSMFFPDLIIDGKASRIKVASVKADHFDSGSGGALDQTIEANNDGWRVASQTYQNHSIVFELASPLRLPKGSRLKFSLGNKFGKENLIRHFRLSATGDTGLLEPETDPIDPEFAKRRLFIEKHLASQPAKPGTKAQSLAELPEKDQRKSFIHVRGDYSREGEIVTPDTPTILHPMKAEKPDRLALAKWLFEAENPLTARVSANQIWQELFGVGIVPTSDDLGTYGADPTHPELLDWLATEFRENGWSRKSLIRTIVLSSTYRQASTNTHPDRPNTLLWRQNSFRLPADLVRDVHLSASGLFSDEIGGPGIYPPLPGFVSAVGRSVKWPTSQGNDRYRRGMYIVLKRTVLYPMLTTFDAPDTSASCSRRELTNTPMQALTLLNDPVFFECAEVLGRDLAKTYQDNSEGAVIDLFSRCLNREPDAHELATLESVYLDFRNEADDPELAMIATARVVMNLNEFITRD
ncbi:MAG: DUF1549 and DUF1553 domain-containing protein [Verrucomicrobiales bacterium]|nr:DUF1549 and DUF1553 domain-containing protein [Verrucomicrobiales bacterium]